MRELATCLLPVRLEIAGAAYRVRPAPARVALAIYAGAEAYAGGEVEAWNVVREACRRWLPLRLFERYFSSQSLPAATLVDLGALLEVGILDTERHDADRKKIEEEARIRSWFAVVADFSSTLSVSPERALDMP